MNSVQEAAKLAADSAKFSNVRGMFAMPPEYFRPSNADDLVDAMAIVAAGAPDLPFWYYHFPVMSNVNVDMFDFILSADKSGKIPNLMGIKYTDEHLMQFNEIGDFKNNKYNMMIGRDEILTGALAGGVADADVGSTLNFISYNIPIRPLFESMEKENIKKA
jgi:N-acetylneuraminate lyase